MAAAAIRMTMGVPLEKIQGSDPQLQKPVEHRIELCRSAPGSSTIRFQGNQPDKPSGSAGVPGPHHSIAGRVRQEQRSMTIG